MDTRTFYDRISAAYDLLADASEGGCRDQGLSLLNVTAGERVLEVGCGTGHALTTLAALVGPTGHVAGVDVSSGMLAVASRAVQSAARTNVTLALNDARALCFRQAAFDAVFMSFTLELFEFVDIPIVLAEVRRVLRPTGRLAIVAMAETETANAMTDVYKWLHRHFPHFIDCRPINAIDLLKRAAFRTASVQRMSIWGLSVACLVAVKT